MYATDPFICVYVCATGTGNKLGWLHILWPPESTHQRPADSQHACCMAYLSIFPGLTDLQPYTYYCNTVLLGFQDVSKMALKLNNTQTVRKPLFAGTVKGSLVDAKK